MFQSLFHSICFDFFINVFSEFLLRLGETQKVLFFLPLSCWSFRKIQTGKIRLANVFSFVTQELYDQDPSYFIEHAEKWFSECSFHCEISCSITTKNIFPLPQCLLPANLADWGTLPIKSQDPLLMCTCKITWQTQTIIYPLPLPMATKSSRVVTYLEEVVWPFNHAFLWVQATN